MLPRKRGEWVLPCNEWVLPCNEWVLSCNEWVLLCKGLVETRDRLDVNFESLRHPAPFCQGMGGYSK